MKVGVFGLGYVGVVNTVCFADLGHEVMGCDVKSQKVESILKGISPVNEPKVNEMLQRNLAAGRIKATTKASELVEFADVILVCVGTPSAESGKVNLDFTINTTLDIANCLSNTSKNITIAYRSTVPPGSVEDNFKKVFEQKVAGYKGNCTFAFYPEFLREGSAVSDFLNAPRIVIGSMKKNIDDLKKLLSYNTEIPIVETDTYTAEFVKYVDNSFHAMKIVFANEMYSIGSALKINVEKANEIFLMDNQLNISKRYLRPGMPFGGSCLPKDLRAVQNLSETNDVETPMLHSLLVSSKAFQKRLFEQIVAKQKNKILLAGFTFKNNTDDVRESPMLALANSLIAEDINISIWDEDINETTLRLENAHLVKYLVHNLENAIAEAELVVVTKRFMGDVLKLRKNKNVLVFNYADLKIYNEENIVNLY